MIFWIIEYFPGHLKIVLIGCIISGLAIASALVTLGNPRKVSIDPTTKTESKTKGRKSFSSQHPDSWFRCEFVEEGKENAVGKWKKEEEKSRKLYFHFCTRSFQLFIFNCKQPDAENRVLFSTMTFKKTTRTKTRNRQLNNKRKMIKRHFRFGVGGEMEGEKGAFAFNFFFKIIISFFFCFSVNFRRVKWIIPRWENAKKAGIYLFVIYLF